MTPTQKLEHMIEHQRDRIHATRAHIIDIRAHLLNPKFQGTEPDGGRKDWISTSDVDRMMVQLQERLL